MRRIPVSLVGLLGFGMLLTAAFRSMHSSVPLDRPGPFAPGMQVRMGWVTVYIPGTCIMIQDSSGATTAYSLDVNVRILPPPRSGTLAVRSHVVVLAWMDPRTKSWMPFGIVVLPPTAGSVPPPSTPTPTFIPSSTPTAIPSETPTLMPAETPTDTPTFLPTDSPTSTPTVMPTDTLAPIRQPKYPPTHRRPHHSETTAAQRKTPAACQLNGRQQPFSAQTHNLPQATTPSARR
jgi:hypothetical protein